MFVRLRFAALAALLLLFNASPARAQLIPGWQAKQFTLERIDSDRIRLQGETEIVGEGPNAGQQIFADHVEWNIRTGEFTATGNVLVVSPTSRLAAERAVFNTKTQLGTFETASSSTQPTIPPARTRSPSTWARASVLLFRSSSR